MSTATLAISAELDSAFRRAFSEAGVKLQPETKTSDIVSALGNMGVSASIQDDVLLLAQGQTQMNTSLALRSFSTKPENAKFFILETVDPRTWRTAKKIEYIAKHGEQAYRKLVQTPVLEAGVRVLDPNMGRADYQNLTRQEKMEFIRQYGDSAVSRIFLRR
jgi:hypothetical protein